MKVVKTKDLEWADALSRGAYSNRRKELGGEKIACGMWELAPGKKSFPLHAHQMTEEAMFVISGTGQVRTQEGLTPIGPGDFVSFPAGGVAHQLVNDGTEPLVYIAMSHSVGADVVEYPEAEKVAAAVGRFPTGKRFMFKKGTQVDYFDGDKDA